MLNDNERDNGPEEEGEYHFSDESGYESSIDEETKAPLDTDLSSGGMVAKFSSYRRLIIIGAIMAGVLLVVYLIVSPPISSPSTEIQEASAPAIVRPAVIEPPKKLAKVEPAKVPAVSQKLPAPTVETKVDETEIKVEGVLPIPQMVMPSVAQAAAPPQALADNSLIAERLKSLEETNSRLIGQLNSQYSQKLVEFESQDKALEEKVRTLNARISTMETQMGQMLQILDKNAHHVDTGVPHANIADDPLLLQPTSSAATTTTPATAMVPTPKGKPTYSVQAIIPGRAWLRADNGETVTVAEGDVLKSMGRITKIDPYDGTIQIDTGSKLLTLSYGSGDYA